MRYTRYISVELVALVMMAIILAVTFAEPFVKAVPQYNGELRDAPATSAWRDR